MTTLAQMSEAPQRQTLVTLDLEGVLIPEVWVATAEATGIEELRRNRKKDRDWSSRWDEEQRQQGYALWQKAVSRTYNWAT